MPDLTPFLWFDTEAEAAAKFYVAIFPNSKITRITHYGPYISPHMPDRVGQVMTVEFELDRKPFVALNGGPEPKFNHAISFSVGCKDQAEIDRYWAQLSDGGHEVACGWLTDRYGLSWQIVPDDIAFITESDAAMTAMMGMVKLDIAALRRAAEGR
jgi:predicted 3-demethylubiquinone-9 3-methyltransferase (glyoxalase superfamily)